MRSLVPVPVTGRSRDRSGLTIVEVLILLALNVQLIGLLVPAVQKVRTAAVRLESTQWAEFGGEIQVYADELDELADDTTAASKDALGEREIDPDIFGDLKARFEAALAACILFQAQTRACIAVEENRLVDLRLQEIERHFENLEPVLMQNIETLDGLSFE